MKKYLFLSLGILCLVAGIIGIILPVVPATPLFLSAAWFFARSSEPFHQWLLNHRWFGKYIRDYVEQRAVRKSARTKALILLWSGMLLTMALIQKPLIAGILALIGSVVTMHILHLRVLPEEDLPDKA